MKNKVFLFYCQVCSWKSVVRNPEDAGLREMVLSAVPAGAPKKVHGKYVTPEGHKPSRKFKCPQCGRVVIPSIIPDTQSIQDQTRKESERHKAIEADAAELLKQSMARRDQGRTETLKRDVREDIKAEIENATRDAPPPVPALLPLVVQPEDKEWSKKSPFSM